MFWNMLKQLEKSQPTLEMVIYLVWVTLIPISKCVQNATKCVPTPRINSYLTWEYFSSKTPSLKVMWSTKMHLLYSLVFFNYVVHPVFYLCPVSALQDRELPLAVHTLIFFGNLHEPNVSRKKCVDSLLFLLCPCFLVYWKRNVEQKI